MCQMFADRVVSNNRFIWIIGYLVELSLALGGISHHRKGALRAQSNRVESGLTESMASRNVINTKK